MFIPLPSITEPESCVDLWLRLLRKYLPSGNIAARMREEFRRGRSVAGFRKDALALQQLTILEEFYLTRVRPLPSDGESKWQCYQLANILMDCGAVKHNEGFLV